MLKALAILGMMVVVAAMGMGCARCADDPCDPCASVNTAAEVMEA